MLSLGSVAAETGSFLVSLGQGGFVYCCNEENLTFSIQIPPEFTPASEGSFTFDDGVLQIIVLPASQVSDNMPNTEQQMLADFVSYEKNYLQTELKLSLSDDGQKPIAIASNTFFLWQYLIESKINSPYPVFRNFVTFKNGYILNLVFQTKAKLDSNGILAHEEKVLNTLHFLSQPVSPEQMAQAIAKAKPDNVDISPNDAEIDTSADIPFSKAPQAVQALEKKHTGLCPFCKANQIPVCVFEEDPRYDVCCSSCRKILETIEIKAAPTPPPSSKEIEKAATSLKHKWIYSSAVFCSVPARQIFGRNLPRRITEVVLMGLEALMRHRSQTKNSERMGLKYAYKGLDIRLKKLGGMRLTKLSTF